MSEKTPPTIRPRLGAWAGLLLVAETACEAVGATLFWKTKSVSGHPDDEYLSLMASAPPTPEGRALMDLLDQLESISDRIDPRTGRMRVPSSGIDPTASLHRELEDAQVLGARVRQSLREQYRRPGMPPMLSHPDHPWQSEADDLRTIAADDVRRIEELVRAATRALGDQERALEWIDRPNRALRGRSPLQVLHDGEVAEIYLVLGRIEHGITE